MAEVTIIGIDLAKRSFSASWFPGRWVGCVPQEAEPGESVGLHGVAAALRGGAGGVRECALLGPGDREARVMR